jgi:iron complex transport system substrate-binding protein
VARVSWIPLVVLAACTGRPAANKLSITDDWGRPVALAAPARRIVSLFPASTELLFTLGLGARVVGRTHFCDWPPAARAVPDLGDGIRPNVEAIAAHRPDLVILYASAANRAAADRLAALGIATAALRVDLASDLIRAARAVGVLADAGGAVDAFVAAFDSSLWASVATAPHGAGGAPKAAGVSADSSGARAAAPQGRRLRLYVDAWASPPMTVGRGSYVTEIIRAAGAENVFGDLAASSATVSLEAIAARDPDAILYMTNDTVHVPDLAARPGWRVVRAARDGRVIVVPWSLFGRPSPRMGEAAAYLAARMRRAGSRP